LKLLICSFDLLAFPLTIIRIQLFVIANHRFLAARTDHLTISATIALLNEFA
jgi:hypothetical protein